MNAHLVYGGLRVIPVGTDPTITLSLRTWLGGVSAHFRMRSSLASYLTWVKFHHGHLPGVHVSGDFPF